MKSTSQEHSEIGRTEADDRDDPDYSPESEYSSADEGNGQVRRTERRPKPIIREYFISYLTMNGNVIG